eukprot:2413102-Prymnesium_polylepis.1
MVCRHSRRCSTTPWMHRRMPGARRRRAAESRLAYVRCAALAQAEQRGRGRFRAAESLAGGHAASLR